METESKKIKKMLAILLVVFFLLTMTATAVSTSACYASSESNVFHAAGCRYVSQINPEHLIVFQSIQDAYAAGYRPCKVCGG